MLKFGRVLLGNFEFSLVILFFLFVMKTYVVTSCKGTFKLVHFCCLGGFVELKLF